MTDKETPGADEIEHYVVQMVKSLLATGKMLAVMGAWIADITGYGEERYSVELASALAQIKSAEQGFDTKEFN